MSNSQPLNVSSTAHHASEISFDDFLLKKEYDADKPYGQKKLAQIYMASYIDHNPGSNSIHALSLMPGGFATNLQKYTIAEVRDG
jgi:coenzyme F420-reducing hydrogenase alpha subunit